MGLKNSRGGNIFFRGMGDNKWGLRWKEIPRALRVYGIGEVKFGHMCYTILSAIVIIDFFSDLDIVCKM